MSGQFIHGDALEKMRGMDDASFRLVVTSPPYNILNSTGGGLQPTRQGNAKWAAARLRQGYAPNVLSPCGQTAARRLPIAMPDLSTGWCGLFAGVARPHHSRREEIADDQAPQPINQTRRPACF